MSYDASMQRRWTKPEEAISVRAADGLDQTPRACVKDVYRAAIEGDVECLEANIAQLGVDVNKMGQPADVWGPRFEKSGLFVASPLHYAVSYNREEAVRFLLAKGARVDQRSASGLTAKDYARRRQYHHLMALMDQPVPPPPQL